MTKQIVGSDTEKDGWTTEIVGELQPNGALLVVGEHRYRTTIGGDCGAKRCRDLGCFGYCEAPTPLPRSP